MRRGLCCLWLVHAVALGGEAAQPTRLLPLKRVTVGPSDNYQGVLSADEQKIHFTRSENMASQLMVLDLRSGLTTSLTEQTADAKSPSLSPDGKRLALTSYQRDAKGDVCLLEGNDIRCLNEPGKAEMNPFWVDSQQLAYVLSNDEGTEHEIWVYDLSHDKKRKLLQGILNAPSLSPDRHTLVARGRANELQFFNWSTQKLSKRMLMPLPGTTGPAKFSKDGRYIYFAQYMVDSNRDFQLDGRDAAAIYRFDWKADNAFPEQMTSLEQNCSFPFPSQTKVYVTCAFEGALDIYSMPLEGLVPEAWTATDLWEAHQVARSYADRIFLLNSLYSRFKALTAKEFEQRNLSDFVFLGEFKPALFYIKSLSQNTEDPQHQRYQIEEKLLETYGRWQLLPQKSKLGSFAGYLEVQRTAIQALAPHPLAAVTQAYFAFFALHEEEAGQILNKVSSDDPHVLYWKGHLEFLLYAGKDNQKYGQLLETMILDTHLADESRLFYVSAWLEWVGQQSQADRLLSQFQERIPPVYAEVIQNERDINSLLLTVDKAEKVALQKRLTKRAKTLQNDYYALRLVFNRSMIRLSRAKRTRNMADVMNVYLGYVKTTSKEFPYALDALSQISLDTAYRFLQGPLHERLFAIGAFFTLARMVDDWESHYQYTRLQDVGVVKLLEQYQSMVKDGLVGAESQEFVKVLINLFDPNVQQTADSLAKAAAKLESFSADAHGGGVKYLVLGYLYQRQIQLNQGPFIYDKKLAEKAHRAYLFAIDAAYGNDRILASALQNLGLLHAHLRNFGLASAYLTKRAELPAGDEQEAIALAWLEAVTHFKSNRSLEAYQTLAPFLKDPQWQAKIPVAFWEKAAFYAWNAALPEAALSAYQLFVSKAPESVTPSILLAYGFAESRSGHWQEARHHWQKVIDMTAVNQFRDVKAPALEIQNGKLNFLAWGFIAQGQYPVAERILALDKRLQLYPQVISHAQSLHFSKENLQSQHIKELLDMVTLKLALQQQELAVPYLRLAIDLANQYGENFQFLSQTCVQTLKNSYVLREDPKLRHPTLEQPIKKLNQSMERAYLAQDSVSPIMTQKWIETRLLQLRDSYWEQQEAKLQFTKKSEDLLGQEQWKDLLTKQKVIGDNLREFSQNISKTL